jgi:hypothetical protein
MWNKINNFIQSQFPSIDMHMQHAQTAQIKIWSSKTYLTFTMNSCLRIRLKYVSVC